jgi:hypothetical protein
MLLAYLQSLLTSDYIAGNNNIDHSHVNEANNPITSQLVDPIISNNNNKDNNNISITERESTFQDTFDNDDDEVNNTSDETTNTANEQGIEMSRKSNQGFHNDILVTYKCMCPWDVELLIYFEILRGFFNTFCG